MIRLKKLDEITIPDSIQKSFVIINRAQPNNSRLIAIDDYYKRMAELVLLETVPEDIHEAFAVVRNLYLYGWFHYPFYTLAGFHAYICLEMALFRKCQATGYSKDRWKKDWVPPLKKLLKIAIEQKWITDEGIRHAQRKIEPYDEIYRMLGEEQQPQIIESWVGNNQKYCFTLYETFPELRNYMAHPFNYSHSAPDSLTIEIVCDLINQLFPGNAGRP